MRKWFFGSIAGLLIIMFSLGVYAKPGKFNGHFGRYDEGGPAKYERESWRQEQNDARFIIHRTANVIYAAQRAAQHGRRYLGLGQAIAHQQMAWDLFGRGSYRVAIFHSLRARNMAFQIIAANRERVENQYYWDGMEEGYVRNAPHDNELDVAIQSVKIGKDNDAVHFSFHLDINQ